MEGLEGKTIIVSGASSGIGAAAARELASSGAQIVVADIDDKGAARTAQAIRDAGHTATSIMVDVRDEASIKSMIDFTIDQYGRIDGLHNNVADIALVVKDTTILAMEVWVWEQSLQTNLTGIFHIIRHALPHMLKNGGGAIVNTSSASAFSGKPVNPAYASSKAGLNALTRHVASAYGRQGVRCNAIAPGAVRTEGAVAAATAMGHNVEAFYKNLRENVAHSHRDGTPEDIAATVALLLSDRGSWINGQCISVDGGWLFR